MEPAAGAWDGVGYARVNTLQESLAARALGAVVLRGDERVLDIGCGDGRVSLGLADRLASGTLLGVDPSPSMLAVARERAAGRPAVTFARGGAEELDAGTFDVVVSFNALHWCRDPVEAVRRAAAAVAPGGRTVLQLVPAGPRPSLEDVAATVAASPGWRHRLAGEGVPFWHPAEGELAGLLRGADLVVTSDEVSEESWDFGDRAAFERWCTVGFAAWTHGLDEAGAARFVTEVVDAYAEATGSPSVFRFRQERVTAGRTP